MAQPGKHSDQGPGSSASSKLTGREADLSQLDFELEFFNGILERSPDYVDVLRVLGSLLSLKGRFAEGLKIDKKLVSELKQMFRTHSGDTPVPVDAAS